MFLLVVNANLSGLKYSQAMSETAASAIIRVFIRFLFVTHGMPEELVSDSGPQFVAQEMKNFLKSNGIRHCLSSPYHPA